MSLRLWILTSTLVLVAAAAGVAATLGSSAAGYASVDALSTVSSRGIPVTLPPEDKWTKHLRRSGFTEVTLLGTVGERNLYRVRRGSAQCYGAGRAGAASPLGVIHCTNAPTSFPSPERPILDLSVVGMDRGDAEMHFIRVEGLASDAVASIGILDRDGTVIERLPVRANIYGAESLPTATGVRLVAFDHGGHVLARVP